MPVIRDRLGAFVPLPPRGTWGTLDTRRAAALVEIGLALSSTLDTDGLLAVVVERDLLLKQFELVNAMTREVLDFARGKVEVFRRKVLVNVFVNDLAEALRRELEPAAVELRVRLSYASAARFDEVKLRRAIVNVARNAAQAMPEGGRFSLHVSKQRDRLVFRMSDTGPGIPEEIRARLFQSFATHGKEDGTGLGLAIVKRIAEEHGGTVECRTRTGRGTTFILSIPA